MSTETKNRGTIHSQCREVIRKVITFCDREKNAGELLFPLECANKRAAAAVGTSEKTVSRIRKESKAADASGEKLRTPGKKRRQNPKKMFIDDFDRGVIRRTIQNFYTVRKEVPTLKSLLNVLKEEIQFPGKKEFLRKLLKEMGFRFKKCKNKRKILMERNDIVAWRGRYLRRMKRNHDAGDKQKTVVYLDETWIHPTYTVSKCWQDNETSGVLKNDSAGQRWIIVHAGSEQGFIPGAYVIFKAKTKSGDYHDEMNFGNFSKWMQEKVIPNLPPNCLLVMDNAPYHSVQVNKAPTTASRKLDIMVWLDSNNIAYEHEMTKSELLQLVRTRRPSPKYYIDGVLEKHGHEVVRLPPYHCELNAIEFVWNMVKRRVAEKNVVQHAADIEQLATNAINSITAEEWRKAILHVRETEKQYWESDIIMEHEMEQIVVQLGGEESSDDSDDDNSDSTTDTAGELSGIEDLNW